MNLYPNLWQGKLVSDEDFKNYFYEQMSLSQCWSLGPLDTQILFKALEAMSLKLSVRDQFYKDLLSDLEKRDDVTKEESEQSMLGLQEFLNIDSLRLKLQRELGSEHPFELKRRSFKENHFEAWFPLGTLVHVTPNNSALLSVLAVIEGLLSGNINLLKLARKDGAFAALFFHELCLLDETQTLKNYLYIAKVSSKEKNYLKDFLSVADAVSVWGNEESVKSVKEMAPSKARIIEWGHKISFAYVSREKRNDAGAFIRLAEEICNNEQMACSSPQCVFVEDAEFSDLLLFSKELAKALDTISPKVKRIMPGPAETAELTVTKEMVRLNSVLGESELIVSKNNDWRIYIENSQGLSHSPLFRTIWVKPLYKKEIIDQLRPLKVYLQTVGLEAAPYEVEELSRSFFRAGVKRVRAIGEMTNSYTGEPHDGVYALERFCQKISYSDSASSSMMKQKGSFHEPRTSLIPKKNRIMEKSDFQNLKVHQKDSDLYFYSGGSSGDPKLSVFTYADYHRQMEVAAEGLYAAGLDPKTDRCMNLFYAGSLYGGFVSFFTILEKLEAVHFPMGASTDFEMVGKAIVQNNVDTLLGMPSYLLALFNFNKELFKEYRGLKKIFFGGEHFSETQRLYLKKEFGVSVIRSASYGSVDAGPLGYQCEFCEDRIHHLNDRLHELEVVDLESDTPVKPGEVGRFLFTSLVRHGQKIERYAIGDVGRIIEGDCPCHRKGTRFELLGRHGDVFRIGTTFLSYQKFQKILVDKLEFEGSFQLHLRPGLSSQNEALELSIENSFKSPLTENELEKILMSHYHDLHLVVKVDMVLDFKITITKREQLTYSNTTGKLRSVIDHRMKT